MDKCRQDFIRYVQSAKAFDLSEKIKLVVFATGIKPAAYVRLKIGPKNLECKAHFEKHLKDCRIKFLRSGPKTYEEISAVKRNAVVWTPAGIWFGYDLFADKRAKQNFLTYKILKSKGQHARADCIGAGIFGYPSCCQKQYTKEHSMNYVRKHYTYYGFYKKTQDVDRKFPYIFHFPCTTTCTRTQTMNARHRALVKRHAPHVFASFTAKHHFTTPVIVDSVSDILDNAGLSIWSRKNGTNAELITKEKINGHHYLVSHLTKKSLLKGEIYPAHMTIRHETGMVTLGKKKGTLARLHHERRIPQWQ
ncbi:hypothetical protein HY490_01955 [Candidatus Woesearchaeota archaeon]|nr:hypothetical protein [Candidatus Woesearchaeota archaeon]